MSKKLIYNQHFLFKNTHLIKVTSNIFSMFLYCFTQSIVRYQKMCTFKNLEKISKKPVANLLIKTKQLINFLSHD